MCRAPNTSATFLATDEPPSINPTRYSLFSSAITVAFNEIVALRKYDSKRSTIAAHVSSDSPCRIGSDQNCVFECAVPMM